METGGAASARRTYSVGWRVSQFGGERQGEFERDQVGQIGTSLFKVPERQHDRIEKRDRGGRVPGRLANHPYHRLTSLEPFKLIKYSRKESDRFSRRENGKTTTSLGPGGIEHDKKVQDSWKATAACPGRPRNHGQGTRGSAK